jgi:hypothetical protein
MPSQRKLTLHQQAVLIHVLLVFPDQHVDICFDPSGCDARAYALNFLTIFKAIGWTVDAPSARTVGPALAFVVTGQGTLPPSAEALRDALRIYEIEVATLCDTACESTSADFVLAIGPQA